jgi:tungstate transport system substrate-binding protein
LFRTVLVLSAAILSGMTVGVQAADRSFIIVQSTTSTQNSGLFGFILPKFHAKTGIEVRVVAVGTGQALKNGRNGDGDVVLVHARAAEDRFIAEGFGVERQDVMYNDFVIIGAPADPAGIRGMKDAPAALAKIASAKALWVSRGDNSGTHIKERGLWKVSGGDPAGASGKWYREAGSGMGATLNTAVGMGAYTLADRATWVSFRNRRDFAVMVEGDKRLFNAYGVMLVNPARYRHVNASGGRTFIKWLTSADGRAAISAYRVRGRQLFYPAMQ